MPADCALVSLREDCVGEELALCTRLVLECIWRRDAFLAGEVPAWDGVEADTADGGGGGGHAAQGLARWEDKQLAPWANAEERNRLLGDSNSLKGSIRDVLQVMVREGELHGTLHHVVVSDDAGPPLGAEGTRATIVSPHAPPGLQQVMLPAASTAGGRFDNESMAASAWGHRSVTSSPSRRRSNSI